MSWFGEDPHDKRRKDEKERMTMSERFFGACLLIFGGVILLTLTLELLASIWVWLLLAALVVVGGVVWFRVWQSRRDRW